MDLERIRSELNEIAQIVDTDSSSGTQSGAGAVTGTKIDLPVVEIMKLAPHVFHAASGVAPDKKVTLIIPDLFDQLTKGRVSVAVSRLIAVMPPETFSSDATMHGDEVIQLPLPLVVASVPPSELQKRTAKQEVDRGDKALPNLFNPTVLRKPAAPAAAPVATPAPAPAATPPPAPVAPPPAPVAPTPPPAAARPVVAPPPAPVAPPAAPVAPPPPASVAPPPAAVAPAPAPATKPEISNPVPSPQAQTPPPAPVAAPAPVKQPESPAPAPVSAPPAPTPVPAAPVAPAKPVEEVRAQLSTAVTPAEEPEVETEPEPKPVIAPHVARSQAEAKEAAAAKATLEAALEDEAGRGTGLHLYGVDLNTVTVDEMVARFNGVGRKLAEKILGDRDANGPFKDVYDIARVPGVKGRVFQKITGMAWPTQLFRHREQVNQLLGVVGNDLPDVRGVAQRFKELDGFLGCIIVHNEDGMILSGTWEHPSAETLGAFAPQMFKKLSRYVKNLKMGTMKTITIFAEDIPFTMVVSGRILFIALHKGTRFSKRQVELVQVLASELGRRLFA